MRWSLLVAASLVTGSLTSCATVSSNRPHARVTARDIVDDASPAVVRIEAGDSKVGTGFIVDSAGLVATNLHVIEGESKIKVKLYKDPTEYPVTSIAGIDRNHDLALIWINTGRRLPTIKLGNSDAVSAGDTIYALGNPLGVFDYSITNGLISQVRPVSSNLTILQISAPISPGSSGGPLFNQYGEVVGITTAIITEGQSINLAVPANYLRPMLAHRLKVSCADFAKATKEEAEEEEAKHHKDSDEDTSTPPRHIPEHPLTIWSGCSPADIEDTVKQIMSAIDIGAPLYNKEVKEQDDSDYDPHGFEECYRVYEGVALKLAEKGACKGVRDAFSVGLTRASTVKSFKDKAWVMRDTFDGLTNAAAQWCLQDSTCKANNVQSSQP